jgi:hypothetical protein
MSCSARCFALVRDLEARMIQKSRRLSDPAPLGAPAEQMVHTLLPLRQPFTRASAVHAQWHSSLHQTSESGRTFTWAARQGWRTNMLRASGAVRHCVGLCAQVCSPADNC